MFKQDDGNFEMRISWEHGCFSVSSWLQSSMCTDSWFFTGNASIPVLICTCLLSRYVDLASSLIKDILSSSFDILSWDVQLNGLEVQLNVMTQSKGVPTPWVLTYLLFRFFHKGCSSLSLLLWVLPAQIVPVAYSMFLLLNTRAQDRLQMCRLFPIG